MMRVSIMFVVLLSTLLLAACGGPSAEAEAALKQAQAEREHAADYYGDSKWAMTAPTEADKQEKPAEPVKQDVPDATD